MRGFYNNSHMACSPTCGLFIVRAQTRIKIGMSNITNCIILFRVRDNQGVLVEFII